MNVSFTSAEVIKTSDFHWRWTLKATLHPALAFLSQKHPWRVFPNSPCEWAQTSSQLKQPNNTNDHVFISNDVWTNIKKS